MEKFEDTDFDFDSIVRDFGENNPYYSPEKCGLKIIAQIELSDGNYQFDTRVVWRAGNGDFYTARDSGCSCPTPFEDYRSLEQLTPLTPDVLRQIKQEMRDSENVSPNNAQDFLDLIRNAYRAASV